MDKEIAEKELTEKLNSMTQQAEEYKVRWCRPSVDNTLRDLQDSLYPTKAEFNNYFINFS